MTRLAFAWLSLLLAGCGDLTANVNGVALDPQGNLVVAYGGYNLIRIVDPVEGRVLRDQTTGVRVPDDVEAGPNGALWWTSLLSGEVGYADAAGKAIILADVGAGVNPIALAPNGRLIVGRCDFGNDLYSLDPYTPSEPEIVFKDAGEGCGLNGMVFGRDGLLYGTQPTMGRVVRVNLESTTLEVLAEGLSHEAYALALHPDGTVYALDGKRVVRVLGGGAVETFVELPTRGDNLVFSADGSELFVSTGPDMRVLGYDRQGRERVLLEGSP
jgi:sugar lactone lactonase YvrE